MAEEVYTSQIYRLRASAPMPVAEGPYDFVIHTFGAEISDVDIFECTQSLPGSEQFRGQGGDLVSASFSRIGDKDLHFQGRQVYSPDYVEEEALGFNF